MLKRSKGYGFYDHYGYFDWMLWRMWHDLHDWMYNKILYNRANNYIKKKNSGNSRAYQEDKAKLNQLYYGNNFQNYDKMSRLAMV